MYIFSYGSNNTQQLRDRTYSLTLSPIAGYIQDYTRIFAGYSKKWKGGVASIAPQKGVRVYGSLVKLNDKELALLDGYEGGYRREVIPVNIDKDHTVNAYVYIRNDDIFVKPPSQKYLEAIRTTLDEVPRVHKNKINIKGFHVDKSGNKILHLYGTWSAV